MNRSQSDITRRRAMAWSGAAALSAGIAPWLQAAEASGKPPLIATNTYPWRTFAARAGRDYKRHGDAALREIAETGIPGYEPIIESVAEFVGLSDRINKHGLTMRSIYVNSVLHDESQAEQSAAQVIAIARQARELGTEIVVTNPSPIRWGGTEDKTDAQLRFQAAALNDLGKSLHDLGLTLAYHNHDAELRQGGREFHHMLTATSPDHVKLCLDSHWIYRGCGNSEVALFDAVEHYHGRIVELHLRQSSGGVWAETFTINGDIDYSRLFEFLATRRITPHLVLEQAVEDQSPNLLSVTQAHQRSRANLASFLSR